MVLLDGNSHSYSYVFPTPLNILNGGNTGNGSFSDLLIMIKPKKSVFKGVSFTSNKAYYYPQDGVEISEYLNFNVSLDSIEIDEDNPEGIFSPSNVEMSTEDIIVKFTPSDEGSGVDYYKYCVSIDGGNSYGNENDINSDISKNIILSENGDNMIKVLIYDNAGNSQVIYSGLYKINKGILKLKHEDRKNFKYYIGKDNRGIVKIMLVSKTGKDLKFNKDDILQCGGDRKNCFKEGIIYIDEEGNFKKYHVNN